MKKIYNLRGGRHFHLILFILLLMVITTYGSFLSSSTSDNSTLKFPQQIESTVETYTPQQIEVNRLYTLITKITSVPDSLDRYQLANAVYTYGAQFSIEPTILLAIARVESNFHKKIIGYGNCVGYWQINLNVHRVSSNFLNDTNQQCEKACEVFVYYRNIFNNPLQKILNGYNGNSSNSNPYGNKVLNYYYQYNQMLKEIN